MNNLSKFQKIFIIGGIVIAGLILSYYIYGKNDEIKNTPINDEEVITNEEPKNELKEKIIVHISGAVKNEGIVKLNEQARVADAIDAAGGLKEDADMAKINLAYILEDGMKIKIPSINEKEEEENVSIINEEEVVEMLPEGKIKNNTIININKASQTELESLPGIGPSIAIKIINYRDENGKFQNIEDLKKVNGVGDNKFENIKSLICVK